MPKLSPISAKKMFKILKKLGFELIRVKGSHHFFLNNKTGKTTTVPLHSKEELSVGLLRGILKDIELSVEEYNKARK